jgi:hypothetical protein
VELHENEKSIVGRGSAINFSGWAEILVPTPRSGEIGFQSLLLLIQRSLASNNGIYYTSNKGSNKQVYLLIVTFGKVLVNTIIYSCKTFIDCLQVTYKLYVMSYICYKRLPLGKQVLALGTLMVPFLSCLTLDPGLNHLFLAD